MNYADARQVAVRLERLGYQETSSAEDADVIVLQTCTVRQSAEDKFYGRLNSLKPLKENKPEIALATMGCVVGVKGNRELEEQFPHVDVWMPPASDGTQLISFVLQDEAAALEAAAAAQRFAIQDEELSLTTRARKYLVSAPVAAVYGCSHACSFCVIPHKRGIERTRQIGEIVAETRSLVEQGVKEVVLLGQIIDRYGKDIPDGPTLADLLQITSKVDGLERIRFLTSHPNYMTDEILEAVASNPKVMPQIEVPIQAGDDKVLRDMKRGYTADEYRRLVYHIREMIPDAAVHCDIIVGFPGESREQFQRTYDLLAELELDKVHIARYSPRPGTVSARRLSDDVTEDEKMRRFQAIEALQRLASERKMSRYLGETVEVLVEDQHRGRWRGRNPQGRLVFFEDERDLKGQLVNVQVTHTGPWSMSGRAADRRKNPPAVSTSIPLNVM